MRHSNGANGGLILMMVIFILCLGVSSRAAAPDLVITHLEAQTPAILDQLFTMTVTVKNQGSAAAGPFRIGFYLSADATITFTDTYFGSFCDIQGLLSGAEITCSGPIMANSFFISPGAYYFGAIADSFTVITESNENNNARVADSGQVTFTWGGPETVSTPGAPTGTAQGTVGGSYEYTASGSASSLGHTVEYRFDWGDGSKSDWITQENLDAPDSLFPEGRYQTANEWRRGAWKVFSLERSDDTMDGSNDSKTGMHAVPSPSENRSILLLSRFDPFWMPSSPLFPGTIHGEDGILRDPTGHLHVSVPDVSSGCLTYMTDASGEWTTSILDCPEMLDEATFISFDSDHHVYIFYADRFTETLRVATNGGSLPLELTAFPNLWNKPLLNGTAKGQKSWSSPGTYLVKSQARCAADKTVESGWSSPLSVSISAPNEAVSPPSAPTGPASGTAGSPCAYSTGGAASNLGHNLEYQFDWSGDESDLSPWGHGNESKTWPLPGAYFVRARARCKTHPGILSAWSGALSVNITAPQGPDLTGQWIELTPSCKTTIRGTQCKVTGKFTVRNNGNKDTTSSFFIRFYLSEDQTVVEGNDPLLKKVSSAKLKAGVSKTIKIIVTLPKGLTTSGKYVIAVIDTNQSVPESNETNNIIQYGPMP